MKTLKISSVLGLTFLHCFTSQAAQPYPNPSGLVSWWKGELDARDSVRTNHGSFLGAATIVPGKVGNGFGFAGNLGAIVIPHHKSLSFTSALTIELWYKLDAVVSNYGMVDKRGTVLGPCNYGINYVAGQGIGPYYNDPSIKGGDQPNSDYECSRYSDAPSPGEFHHLAVTFQQLSPTEIQLKTYLDGALVRSIITPGALANAVNTAPFVIGATASVAEPFFGIIDEVSVYNRALTESEVMGIYQADTAGKLLVPFLDISVIPVVNVYGQPGETYRLDYIQTLNDTNGWMPLTTLTLTNNFDTFIDTTAMGAPHRNYRAIRLP